MSERQSRPAGAVTGRAITVVIVGGLIGAILTGCESAPGTSSASGGGTPGFAEPTAPPLIPETQRNADREYRRVSRLIPEPLPPGRAYPPALPDRMIPASSDGVMEQGLGRYVAWYTWLCAWESAYLTASASDDKPALAAAEAKLNQWPSMEFHRDDEDDPDHVWTTNVLDKMNLDDPSGVKSDYDSLCSDFPTVAAK